jgi:hypothetical protein
MPRGYGARRYRELVDIFETAVRSTARLAKA